MRCPSSGSHKNTYGQRTNITTVQSPTCVTYPVSMSAQQYQYVFQTNKPKLRKHTKSRKGCLACKARKVKVGTCHLCISAFVLEMMDADHDGSVLRLCPHVHTAPDWTLNVSIHTYLTSCQRHPVTWSNKTHLLSTDPIATMAVIM